MTVTGIVAAIGLVDAGAAGAQNAAGTTAAANDALLQEIVVTAPYREEGPNDSMKLGIAVKDTPFSVENYTGSFLKSIETTQIADLYRYMTGLQKAGTTGYDLTLRGFSTNAQDRNTVMTDGLPGLSVRFGSPPTAGTDHIELVKGAASLLYGISQPGGFVNVITKKPEEKAFYDFEARGTVNGSVYGRVHGGDLTLDVNTPVGSSDRVLFRMVGQLSNDYRYQDASVERGQYLLPEVTVKLGDSTTLTEQFEYREDFPSYANTYLLLPNVNPALTVGSLPPINTNYIQPGTYNNERGTVWTTFLNHKFDGGATWNLDYRSVNHHDTAFAYDITGFDKTSPRTLLDLRARGQLNQRTYNFVDTNVVLPFHTGFMEHRAIVGVDFGKEIDDFLRKQFCAVNSPGKPAADATCNPTNAQYTINLYNPDWSTIPSPTYFGPGALSDSARNDNYLTSVSLGAYVSDLITWTPHWKTMVGLRYAHDKLTDNNDTLDPADVTYEQTYSAVLPQVGVIYEPTKNWSLYANYSTSYNPVDPATIGLTNGPAFKPTDGEGAEVGAKNTMLNGRLATTAALFDILQKNVVTPYPFTDASCPTGGCSVQVGAARSKGAELEMDAKPIDEWTLIAGYAYTDARVTGSTSTGPLIGHVLPNSPFNSGHVWTRYDFLDGPMRGFGAGIGWSYTSTRITSTGTGKAPQEFYLPSYQVFDLALYKVFSPHFDLTFKVNNLFDKVYFQSGKVTSGMENIVPGLPRTMEVYLHARF